jgi:hypothetical protein
VPERPLFAVRRQHLELLSGPLGVWQHARGTLPDEAFGTCTDDVARALTVDLLHRHELGWEAVRPTARRSLAYLAAAFDPAAGTFRNFRDAGGAWLDAVGSQDSQGRALLALGTAAGDIPESTLRLEARTLFGLAVPRAGPLTSPRAVASALLGCDAALVGGSDPDTERTFARLAARLRRTFARASLEGDWPWPEATLTYENALLPHALLIAARRLGDPGLLRDGLRVLDWLIGVQTSTEGCFSPIGNTGWFVRGGSRSQFDQQPIEATATILAAATAFDLTHDAHYRKAAEAAYGWFLGDNDLGIAIADVATGGCRDGLTVAHASLNQGAESTLMWLTALETMRTLRSRGSGLERYRPIPAAERPMAARP